ncbi:MAG: toxin [Desulfovibrionales bacterium]
MSFEEVVLSLSQGGLLDIIEHPNAAVYPGQRIFIVQIREYVHLVPYVEDKDVVFLKTVIPSRKMTARYLGGKRS